MAYKALSVFLQDHRRKRNGKRPNLTHVSMGGDYGRGSFVVDNDELPEFHRLYSNALYDGIDMAFVEQHAAWGPVVIDLDFKYLAASATSMWRDNGEEHFLRALLTILSKKLFAYVDVPADPTRSEIFVFGKGANGGADPILIKGGDLNEYKDGVHIMVPRVRTRPEIQFVIRQEILNDGEFAQLLQGWGVELTNDVGAVYDKSVIKANGWMMLGSHKDGAEAYQVHSVWQGSPTAIHGPEPAGCTVYTGIAPELVNLFSIRASVVTWQCEETALGRERIEYNRCI